MQQAGTESWDRDFNIPVLSPYYIPMYWEEFCDSITEQEQMKWNVSGLHNLLTSNLIFRPQNILSSTFACNAVHNSLPTILSVRHSLMFFLFWQTEIRGLCAQGTLAVSNPNLQTTSHLDKEDLPGSPSKFNQKGLSNSWVVEQLLSRK